MNQKKKDQYFLAKTETLRPSLREKIRLRYMLKKRLRLSNKSKLEKKLTRKRLFTATKRRRLVA